MHVICMPSCRIFDDMVYQDHLDHTCILSTPMQAHILTKYMASLRIIWLITFLETACVLYTISVIEFHRKLCIAMYIVKFVFKIFLHKLNIKSNFMCCRTGQIYNIATN